MKPFSFNVNSPKKSTNSFLPLKKLLEEKKCSLEGNEQIGRIVWLDGVEGTYSTKANFIEITIEKNPFKIKKPVELYIRWVFHTISRHIDSQEMH